MPGNCRGHLRKVRDYGVQQLETLDEIATRETGLGQGGAQTLLRSLIGLLIAEPSGGKHQLRIHPLAMAALERFRIQKKTA
jgi:hypothetical protein